MPRMLAVLVAAGPVVRRLRRLTSDVRRSAADRYATPVAAHGRDEIGELARAFDQRALSADEIFDMVCEKIIDTVVLKTIERGGSAPAPVAEPEPVPVAEVPSEPEPARKPAARRSRSSKASA